MEFAVSAINHNSSICTQTDCHLPRISSTRHSEGCWPFFSLMGTQALLRAFIIPEDFSFLLWMLAISSHSVSELGVLQDLLRPPVFKERAAQPPRHRTDPAASCLHQGIIWICTAARASIGNLGKPNLESCARWDLAFCSETNCCQICIHGSSAALRGVLCGSGLLCTQALTDPSHITSSTDLVVLLNL